MLVTKENFTSYPGLHPWPNLTYRPSFHAGTQLWWLVFDMDLRDQMSFSEIPINYSAWNGNETLEELQKRLDGPFDSIETMKLWFTWMVLNVGD